MKNWIVGVGLLLIASIAYGTQTRSIPWPDSFFRMNGQPIHRATLTPDNTTAEDNTTAAGGTAVQYTFRGGERICIQALTTDAYVEVIAAASMTAAGALGFTVFAGQALDANCLTLKLGSTKISALCTAAGPCLVKLIEKE
jgi:hypothetical protein